MGVAGLEGRQSKNLYREQPVPSYTARKHAKATGRTTPHLGRAPQRAFGHGRQRAVARAILQGLKGRLSEVRGEGLALDEACCGSEHRQLQRQQGVRVGGGGSRPTLLSGGRPPLSPVFTTFSTFLCFFQTKSHRSKLEIRMASCSDRSLANQLY